MSESYVAPPLRRLTGSAAVGDSVLKGGMTNDDRFTADSQRSAESWSRAIAKQRALLRFGGILLLAGVYFASARLGLSMAFVAEQVSAVWPPSGVALAAVLLFGPHVWPGIALGAFLANAMAHEPIPTAMGIAFGNTLEALIGAALLRYAIGFDNSINRVRDAIGLILLSAGVSTMISATIGVTSLCLGRVYLPALERPIQWSDFGALWWIWWLGDAMGVLVVAPPLLTWIADRKLLMKRRQVEMICLIIGLFATMSLMFFGGFTTDWGHSSLAYGVFPFVIWAALRLGQPATTAVTLVASSLTIWATLHNVGPFSHGSFHERFLLLQLFMGVVAVTGLLLGAALAERRHAERELRKSQEDLNLAVRALREVDQRKDEFLATLAHELRNPLAPIRAGIDILRLPESPKSEHPEILGMLDRQVQQITRLVDDLLDVSRVTRGKVRLQMQPIDLVEVVERAIETSRPLLEASGDALTVTYPPEPVRLQGDPTRLAQVFANLLNNAAKYSDRGARIEISAAREGNEAVVRVRDSGHGIDRSMLPHVFELFVQADRSLSRAEGGLGIGLTLVHRIVEMHGGTVQAFSDGLGKGSEFVVRLPLAKDLVRDAIESMAAPASRQAQRERAPKRRILIVDDNVDAARSLELLLKGVGHDVRTTYSGTGALELVSAERPDIVLLDIGLPGIDGYEVARRIRQQPHGKDIVLVAVTGWGQADDRRRAADAGFNHHLTKPVEFAALSELLGRLEAAPTADEHRRRDETIQ